MASYTDKIPTFNPYVQQLPIDAMLKVGAYKQEKYEEGVKRIQTSIDNVAGLDIANAAQQQYLQSKLNSLGNNLKWVAAGDFSDFSLVNSVNGMTKQITKDEDVINAVSSTAKLRAGYKKRAELEKKGLTDKNNDDYYNKDASAYINSEDVKASFNSDYVPYTNIIKKLQEALVNAGESKDIVEEIFITGNDGKPLITNGHYTYADAKTIDKLVTNKPAVMAAISNVLNEGSVKQQIGIDGWATYRNVEATKLLEPLKMQYDQERSSLQQQQLDTTALLIAKNLSPEQKEAYTNANKEIEAALLRNDKTFLSLSEQAENSPEQFKENFYAQEFKQRLMTQFVKEEKSRTYGTNEALQQQNWRDTMAFNVLQEKNKIAYQNRTLAVSESKNQLDWLTFSRDSVQDPVTGEWNKKDTTTVGPDGKPKKPGVINANPIFKGDNPGDKVSAINIVENDIDKLTVDKDDIAFGMYADLMRINHNNAGLSDKVIEASVNKYAKDTGVTPSQFLNRWAFSIKNKYAEMGLKPPPNFQEDLTNYNTTSKNLSTKVITSKTALAQAIEEAGVDKVLNDVKKGKKEFKFNINGEIVTITPDDMLDITSDGTLQQIALGYGSQSRDPYNLQINQPNLTSKQNKFLSKFNTLSPEMKAQIYKEANLYKGAGKTISDAREKARKLYNDKLSKIVGVSDVITQSLPMGSADEIKATVANVSTYITGAERSFEGGEEGKKGMIKALANPTGISWVGKKPTNSRETWTGSIIVTGADGNKYKVNDVNHDDLESFTGKTLTNYIETPIQDAINMNTNTKSTNPKYLPGSELAWTTAHLQEHETNPDILNSGWGYRADAVKAGGGYRMINYVRVPGTKKYVTIYGDYVAPEENIITNTFKTVTPVELKNLYLQYVQSQTQNK